MHHGVEVVLVDRGSERAFFAHIGMDEGEPVAELGFEQVHGASVPPQQRIDRNHAVPVPKKALARVRPDVPRPACH